MNILTHMKRILPILIGFVVLAGCATIDVDDPNAAVVNVEFRNFPKSMLGNQPFIRKLNGEVVFNIRKKTFRLMPGEYTAEIQQKSYGVNHKANIDFTIPSKGTYTLVITWEGRETPLVGKPKLDITSKLTRSSE